MSDKMKFSEMEKTEIKRIEEMLKEKIKPSYVVRKATQSLRELPYEQIFVEAALLLFARKHRKINDKEFDDYWSGTKKDYLNYLDFVFEQEKMHLAEIEKVVYSLKEKEL